MNRSSLAVLSLFSFFFIFTSLSVAQLGEVAGQPHFNVSLGGSTSIIITVVNQAAYPLPVKVVLPSLSSRDANAITPRVSSSVTDGVVPAGGDLHINLTVFMPEGTNKPGYTWTGVMQVVTVPNTTAPGSGAQILEGVAKIVTITATTHVASLWDYLVPAVIVVIVIAAVAVVLVLRMKGMLGGKAAAARSRSSAKKARSASRARTKRKSSAARRRATKGRSKGRAKRGRRAARGRRRRT